MKQTLELRPSELKEIEIVKETKTSLRYRYVGTNENVERCDHVIYSSSPTFIWIKHLLKMVLTQDLTTNK